MSKSLLIAEPPLQVLPSLAVKIGLNEAIVLQQVHYWINRSTNIRDGHLWVYKTLNGWAKEFPFWSKKTVQRTIESLEACSLLISTSQYNENASNRTKWYRIDEEILAMLCDQDIDRADLVNLTTWAVSGQNDQMDVDKKSKSLNKVVDQETTTETTDSGNPPDPADPPDPPGRPRDPMFDAIVDVCILDPKIAPGYIGKTKKDLLAMGKTPQDVLNFGVWWYENDWRGKKGQAPTQNQLVLDIAKPNGARNNTNPDKGPEEDAELAARLHAFFEQKRQQKERAQHANH